jgi:RNA polymerase sigma factor for flagellar operon FliA
MAATLTSTIPAGTTAGQRLTSSEAEALWREWKTRRDARSRDALVLAYAPMVRYIASRKVRELPAHCDVDDLASAGLVALMEAIDRFDPAKGAHFEQYAWTRVAGALVDELRKQDWASRSVRREGRRIERARDAFFARTGLTPTEVELAAELGTTVDGLRATLEDIDRSDVGSLNAPARGADDATLVEVGETIQAPQGEHEPENALLNADRSAVMRAAIDRLSERERHVLALVHVQELPGAEIGRVLGVSESRVSQILSGIRSKLKQHVDAYDAAAT